MDPLSMKRGQLHSCGYYSPIKRIPTELWSMIFTHCLPTTISNDPPRVCPKTRRVITDSRLAPILIASVCRVWRHIACGTPKLWESCWVNFVHPELNTIWLRRAGRRNLHLYGKWYKSEDLDRFRWEPLVLSILPFHKRWKSLELEVGKWGNMNFILEFDTPELETFRISEVNEVPVWMAGLLSNAPRLRELELDYVWFGLPLGIALESKRFPQLANLRVHMITASDVIAVLSMLPQLHHFAFYLDDTGYTAPDLSPITHTNLLSLRIDGDLSLVLDKIIAPSLCTFQSQYGFQLGSFISFLDQSHCHITELKICDSGLYEEEIFTALSHKSLDHWLEKLELVSCHLPITRRFIDFLCYSSKTRRLPHLTKLSFDLGLLESIPDGFVADVVASRCGLSACKCEDCGNNPDSRSVRLQHVIFRWLGRDNHILDLARMVPLPPVGQVHEKEALTVIDFLSIEDRPVSNGFEDCSMEDPVKICLGRSTFCCEDMFSEF